MNKTSTPALDAEAALRGFDLALALAAGALVAAPAALAALCARRTSTAHVGANGLVFDKHAWRFGDGPAGRLFNRLGAAHWPNLLHIVKGDMAWVGPRPRTLAEAQTQTRVDAGRDAENTQPRAVRPGLVNTWFVRRRTAVDFGSEREADEEDLRRRSLKGNLGLLVRGALAAGMQASRAAATDQVRLCDVVFDNVDMPGAIAKLGEMLALPPGRTQQVCFVNPACVNIAARHRAYRRTLNRAALVLPDGIGTKIAADLLGTPLKQNVNGTDLFPRLMALMGQQQRSVFLLGGQVGVAEQVAQEIRTHWPQVRLAGVRDGFFAVAEEGDVAAEVRRSGANLLLVARGVPSQDLFIDRHRDALGVQVAMGVGGLFDFVSGRISRAPSWMRDVGLEWVYRFMQEPSRMWRRYLLGNFSFLGRVALQRLRLRAFADDLEPATQSQQGSAAQALTGSSPLGLEGVDGVRAVLFATGAAAADLPVPADFPAALLPMGHTTAIEYQIEQLALVGVRQVDIVVCHGPELIRRQVGEGQRWGVRIAWHLAKDPERPYRVLASDNFANAHRLLLGHADAWVPTDAVASLVAKDGAVVGTDSAGHAHWCGFASGPPDQFAALGVDTERHELAAVLAGCQSLHLALDASRCVSQLDAASLLKAQQLASQGPGALAPPLSWLNTTWGAMSPHALVHPSARITGPVWIGPGCVVEAGAVLGPHAWLSRDVIVSSGTSVSRALVLPATYLGKDLTLERAVVSGGRVRHLSHGVETVLPAADGVMLDLGASPRVRSSVLGRLLAGVALAALLPAVALPLGLRRLRGQALPWVRRTVVMGRHALRPGPRTELLHCAVPAVGRLASAQALVGPLLDVLAGRRSWFGARARTPTQWYALSAEWQSVLSQAPVGLIHAAAWSDSEASRAEAEAVADVFHAARRGLTENIRMLKAQCGALWVGRPPVPGPVSRPVWRASK